MANASLQSFRRIVTVNWPTAQEAQAKAALLNAARSGHEKIMREQSSRAGIAPEFTAYANRPGNADLESVVLPGPIVFRYRYHREIIGVAMEMLRAASPFVKGDYVRGHTIFVNGKAVETLPPRLDPGAEIMIANPVPYARRIEVGKTKSGRSFVMQVPDRIYERVAAKLQARYRNSARIEFNYVTLSDAFIVTGGLQRRTPRYLTSVRRTGGARATIMRKRNQKVGTAVRAPAIIIEVAK